MTLNVNPDELLRQLDKLDSQASLRNFIELGWHVLEPKRKFQGGWHIDAVCDALTAVSMGHIKRLLINEPPGCMKSLTTDVFWPAWEWGPFNAPSTRYVSASYSQDLTVRDNRRTRTLIQSNWYQSMWVDRFRLVSDQNAKTRFDNDHTGFKLATSVGGLSTGERGDRFVIDDPHNIKDGESEAKRRETVLWFEEVVPTRVNDPTLSAIICIMQCIHAQDVSAIILEKELGYTHLMLPMEFEPERKCYIYMDGFEFEDPRTEEGELLWPERMTRAVVERDKQVLGPYAVAGQFQQRPAPRGGGMFKRTWWRYFHGPQALRPIDADQSHPTVPKPDKLDWTIMSVDATFAKTKQGSRVGILVIGGKGANRYVLDNRTRPMSFTETCDEIQLLKKAYPQISRILIEKKANGDAIIDFLHSKVQGLIPINPEGGKEARASAIQPQIESGNIYLPEGAHWLEDFVTEFALFPSTAKNDQVDSLSQALNYMAQSQTMTRALGLGKL